MLLPHKFFERPRAHARGEWLRGFAGTEQGIFAAVDVGRSLAEFLGH
jgi:hypothetical protein